MSGRRRRVFPQTADWRDAIRESPPLADAAGYWRGCASRSRVKLNSEAALELGNDFPPISSENDLQRL